MKHFLSFLLILVALALPYGCGKMPRNGLLDGHWQLTHIDDRDVKSGSIYWSFQLDLVEWYTTSWHNVKIPYPHHGLMGRFQYNGKTLHFTQAYSMKRGDDRPVTPDQELDISAFGVPSIPTSYRIEQINASSMVLITTTGQRLVFRKF